MDNTSKPKTSLHDVFEKMGNGTNLIDSVDYLSWKTTGMLKDYSLKEISDIINSGSVEDQRKLSKNYFYKDGFYKRLLVYLATLLKYNGLLIPYTKTGTTLQQQPKVLKKYYNALEYVENIGVKSLATRICLRALVNGAYFGVISEATDDSFVLLDLPSEYCKSRYKDIYGTDIIEFDVRYFDTITEEETKERILKTYPSAIEKFYRARAKKSTVMRIPVETGVYFSFLDGGQPPFLSVISTVIQYNQAVDVEAERQLEGIKKILVQEMPHLTDGTLVFEPEEVLDMHEGTVKMVGKDKNISVLTTYGKASAINSNVSNESVNGNLEKMAQNIYAEAGTSSQIFAPTGSQALGTSITNDTAFMMMFAEKFSRLITRLINEIFSSKAITFKYTILPVTLYNQKDYVTDAFKLAQSGYSYFVPSVAMDISQRDLVALKSLETDALGLKDILQPLGSAYTQSKETQKVEGSEEDKRIVPEEKKAEQTIKGEQSKD